MFCVGFLKKKKLLLSQRFFRFYIYITIYYSYCLRHAFGSAMSFIGKKKYLSHGDSNDSSFPLPLNEEAEPSVWAVVPCFGLHRPESPLSTLCSCFESQQRNGWNAEIQWSESSARDHRRLSCHSTMARVPVLVPTRQNWPIDNISVASIKKPPPMTWSHALRFQHVWLQGGSYLGKLRSRLSLTTACVFQSLSEQRILLEE